MDLISYFVYIRHKSEMEALIWSIQNLCLDVFNFQNEYGYTPLMIAVDLCSGDFKNDYRKIIEVLLEKGANPHIENNWGRTAFDITKDEDIKELLRKPNF